MKVMCINDLGWVRYVGGGDNTGPQYGDIDAVVETRTGCGMTAYQLERFLGEYFLSNQFIPISEIDEMEFERNYNLQEA